MTTQRTTQLNDDEALDCKSVCARFGISRFTRNRWQEKHDFPKPDFYVGFRGFTWKSTLEAWVASRPRESAAAGKFQPNSQAHQAA